MNDQQMDRLLRQLDSAATPTSQWVSASLAELLPAVRQARQRDASPIGQLMTVRPALRRLLREVGSRKTLMGIAVALVLTGMLAAFLVGGSKREPPGGPTGLLIVVTDDGGLQAIDVRNSSTTELLPPSTGISAVSRSPDGRVLAYRARDTRGDHYEVMATDGTGRRRVATNLAVGGESCHDVWSPNSRFLVTGVDVVGGSKGRIVVVDIPSGEARFVTPDTVRAGCPIWSPDGEWIAYTTSDASLRRVRPDGTGAETIAEHVGGATSWSSDGWIYWDNPLGGGVRRTQVTTGVSETVSDERFGVGHAPALSPGGTQLAVVYQLNGTWTYDLYLSAPDGSGPHRLASDVVVFDGWSADGQFLLVVSAVPLNSPGTGGLVAIKSDGSERRLLRAVSKGCSPTSSSNCFKDIGWGQSRP